MQFEIKYYLSEQAKRSGVVAYKEVIGGDKNYAENWAKNKLRSLKFVAFDITQK